MSSLLTRLFRSREGETKTQTLERHNLLLSAPAAAASSSADHEKKYPYPDDKEEEEKDEHVPEPPRRRQRTDERGSSRRVEEEKEEEEKDTSHGTQEPGIVSEDDVLKAELTKIYRDFCDDQDSIFVPSPDIVTTTLSTISELLQRLKPAIHAALTERLQRCREQNRRFVQSAQDVRTLKERGDWSHHLPTLINMRGTTLDPDKTTIGGLLSDLEAWAKTLSHETAALVRPHLTAFRTAYEAFCTDVLANRSNAALLQLIPSNTRTIVDILRTIRWPTPESHPWIQSLSDGQRETLFRRHPWATPKFFQTAVLARTIQDIPDLSIDVDVRNYVAEARNRLVQRGFREALPILYEHARQETLKVLRAPSDLSVHDIKARVKRYQEECLKGVMMMKTNDSDPSHLAQRMLDGVIDPILKSKPKPADWAAFRATPSLLLDSIQPPTFDEEEEEEEETKMNAQEAAVLFAVRQMVDFAQHDDALPRWPGWNDWTYVDPDLPDPSAFWSHVQTGFQPCETYRTRLKQAEKWTEHTQSEAIARALRKAVQTCLVETATSEAFCKQLRRIFRPPDPAVDVSSVVEQLLGIDRLTEATCTSLKSLPCIAEDVVWNASPTGIALSHLYQALDVYQGVESLAPKLKASPPPPSVSAMDDVDGFDCTPFEDRLVPFAVPDEFIEQDVAPMRDLCRRIRKEKRPKHRLLFVAYARACRSGSLTSVKGKEEEKIPTTLWSCVDRLARVYVVDAIHSIPKDLSEMCQKC
jgi:hypothetical protein